MSLSNKEAARIIKQCISLLKESKLSQQDIELRLNYTSLSKVKNYDKYPQVVIEKKTRNEILNEIKEEFDLYYNEADDRIEFQSGKVLEPKVANVQYYIMHYYAFARGVVDRAVIQIQNKRKVVMDYRIPEHWEGTYSVVESYTFIELTKMGYATPVKKLLSLFSGTMKYGHDYLLGTYSTVKKDGFPAAGRVILEKAANEEAALKKLRTESDFRIVSYLKDNVYVTKLFTPTSLDAIVSTHFDHYIKLTGSYKFIIPSKNENWSIYNLVFRKDFTVEIEINDVIFNGFANFININVLNISFSRKNQDNIAVRKQALTINVNVRKMSSDNIFTCTGSSPIIHGVPSAFSAYMILEEYYKPEFLKNLNRQLFLGEPLEDYLNSQ